MYIIAYIQEISILPLQKGLEFPEGGGGGWRGCVKPQHLKKCVKLYWNFQRGGRVRGGGGLRKHPFCGGGMDIFWNYTF